MVFADGFNGWILPGGGMEDGEDHRSALVRELREETGAPEIFIGPPLWHRTTLMPNMGDGRWDGQHNTTFLVPCRDFEPAPQMSADELAAEGLAELAWWTVAEIAEADAASPDVIRPNGLAELVERVLEHGAPAEPWDLGTSTARRSSSG